jgi:hypothetical protein
VIGGVTMDGVLGKPEAFTKYPRGDLVHQADIYLVTPLMGAYGALGTRLTHFLEPRFNGANYAASCQHVARKRAKSQRSS